MHFDAALERVPARFVGEFGEIEIGGEFAVETGKQIEVESGGYAGGIIVSEQLGSDVLHQVGSKEQGIARAEDFPDVTEETFARAAIEIADRAAEKKHEKVIAGLAVAVDGAQSIEIRPLEPDDADKVDVAEFLFAGLQGGGRDFDWVVAGFLTPRKGFENPAGLFAASVAGSADLVGRGKSSTISAACSWRRRASARVSPYSGRTLMASKRAEPSSSYKYFEGSSRCSGLVRPARTSAANSETCRDGREVIGMVHPGWVLRLALAANAP